MNYKRFKETKNREYLGYCPEKGYIYSVQVSLDEYKIVAIKENKVITLITFTVGGN